MIREEGANMSAELIAGYGKIAVAVTMALVWLALSAGNTASDSDDWLRLSFRGEQHWSFVGPAWPENEQGVISPPHDCEQHWASLAFYTGRMYNDLEMEFEFRRDSGHCGVGVVVRAQDPQHYYLVEFPFTGQQIREGHFWAAIGKVGESDWAKILRLERVPGIPAAASVWNQGRIIVRGNEIHLFVNNRPFPVVRDDTYAEAGYVGLLNWGGCSLRNVRIRGTEVPPQAWNQAAQPSRNWFHPYPAKGTSSLTRAPNGDLLMMADKSVVRSTDQGRTWQELRRFETDHPMGIGTLATTRDGRVLLVRVNHEKPFLIQVANSEDNGNTWSDHERVSELKLPEVINTVYTYGQILELRDGTLLFFGSTYPPFYELLLVEGRRYRQGYNPGEMNFCIRSTDGGRTWSGPINIDGPNPNPQMWLSFNAQLSEVSAMETREGEIIAFVRPGPAWAMWETRSQDGGQTWSMLTTGPFLSYACAAVPRATASGALLVGGRFPGLGLQVSTDNGMTWDTYQIDTEIWAMGGMYEVAPDVVLWVYGSGGSGLRAQFIRITPDGPEPARDMLPAP